MKISPIYKIIDKSTCPHKENLKKVIRILRKNNDFFIFFVNILIDFRTYSVDQSHLTNFLNSYLPINISLPVKKIASNLHFQLISYFGVLILNSRFNFFPSERHINVIPHYTFHEEHYPEALAVVPDDIYADPKHFIEEKINEDLDGAISLRIPYRRKTIKTSGLPDIVQKRIVWLAKYEELNFLVELYSAARGVSKKDIRATAVNDILGLGFKDPATNHDTTLLLYLIFPDNLQQKYYKPTFIEGPLWGYEENL